MKTKRIAFLMMLVLCTVNTAMFAADDTDARISVHQPKSLEKEAYIRVSYLSDAYAATLRIKDKHGNTLHREALKDGLYMKKYDFSKLPVGKYTVEVKTKKGLTKEAFQISSRRHAYYFKPGVIVGPDMVKLAFMNKVDAPVYVRFYDSHGKVLYEEKVASQEMYAKGLNVSGLLRGQYSLAIVGDQYTYTRSIELK